MEFRKARATDVDNLTNLESECFHCPWTHDQFDYEINNNEFSTTLVVYQDKNLIGYINYWIIFDQATINKICVREDYRKKGIGNKLLKIAFDDFIKAQCIVVTLEVRVSNLKAINLYEKNGFKRVLTKENYYSDGEDAFYMVKGVVSNG